MQQTKVLLTMLGNMGCKPQVKFDKLFQKLFNPELWFSAYLGIAAIPGNMTRGVDGKTIDGAGMRLINSLISELKASSYKPHPARRVYIPKANGNGKRPLGIPCFRDKLLMTVLKLILEAIYEPTFSNASHGFRPGRSCHTAIHQVKTKATGVHWWVEGDIKGFFDNVDHEILLKILGKRITDQRFLHLISQLLRAGYYDNWQYHKTYSGTVQGGNLSPILSNIYLNELDQAVSARINQYNKGKVMKMNLTYHSVAQNMYLAKKRARLTGNWNIYKSLRSQLFKLPSQQNNDPDYRRLVYYRYADDTLFGLIGPKADAEALKVWLESFLKTELNLELSKEKTLITHVKKRVRFLGYDVQQWKGQRILRFRTKKGSIRTQRTGNYRLRLLLPRDKTVKFAKEYGDITHWNGKHRAKLLNLSELEILMCYNAEVRGFFNYYSLADNLKDVANKVFKLTRTSFFRTLAGKRRTTMGKVIRSLKRGSGRYSIFLRDKGRIVKEYALFCSTRQLNKGITNYRDPDDVAKTFKYQSRSELGKRILANTCEWCGTVEGPMEVHHIRKLKDLKGKGKEFWEKEMIERQRKTMVLCIKCHRDLHRGKLKERAKVNNLEAEGELES